MSVLTLTVIVVLVAGLAGAVAASQALDRRTAARFRATTVRPPAQLNGVARNTSPRARAVGANFAVGGFTRTQAAVYGRVGQDAVVVLARKPRAPLSVSQQTALRTAFERAFAIPGYPLRLVPEPDPGALGGWIGCGPDYRGLEICLALNSASVVAVVSGTGSGDPVSLLRTVRASTVEP